MILCSAKMSAPLDEAEKQVHTARVADRISSVAISTGRHNCGGGSAAVSDTLAGGDASTCRKRVGHGARAFELCGSRKSAIRFLLFRGQKEQRLAVFTVVVSATVIAALPEGRRRIAELGAVAVNAAI